MSAQDDRLQILFLGADAALHDEATGPQRLLEAFSAAPPLCPEWVRIGRKQVPLDAKSCAKALVKDRVGDSRFLYLGRSSAPAGEINLILIPGHAIGTRLYAKFPLADFGGASGVPPRVVIDLLRAFAHAAKPAYGFAHSLADGALGADPNKASADAEKRVYEAYWLNLYGAEMVKRIGRERLQSMPCASRDWLADGSVLFTTTESPTTFALPAAREAQAALLAHLCPDREKSAYLADLLQRSAELAPVTPAFDQDVKELLTSIVEAYSVGHRPAETARLNAYHPPPVAERVGTLEADVDDVEAEVERYGDLAERIVALLHKTVPAIAEAAPDVLPLVDYHFWLNDYPRLFSPGDIERDLVPAVGAFIGEMMVNHLGAAWIPRLALLEAGVEVRGQVFLPFLRARNFLVSRDAVRDHSLTQFYRVAARS